MMHKACFSPVVSTWIHAIKQGHFATWPGLTAKAVTRHLPKSIATVKGHLDQERKNKHSTKLPNVPDDDMSPTPPSPPGIRTNHIYADAIAATPTGQIFSDLTGRFPHQSSQGHKYILIVYDYDSNAIEAVPLKNRTAHSIKTGYESVITLLQARGLRPQLQRLDNEASETLRSYLTSQDINFQLVPPHTHRRNAAERAIRTFKNHFIAGLCSLDKQFPLHLWNRLLPQATMTLNMLRTSRINPKLSAYAQLHGQFNFNVTPLAPPGTRVVGHEKPDNRATWSPHGTDGWYIGPAMHHYRCYNIYIPATQSQRYFDTVAFFPTTWTMPQMSATDQLRRAAQTITQALRNPHPAMPLSPLADTDLQALEKLASIFNTALPRVALDNPPTTPATPRVRPAPLPDHYRHPTTGIAGRTRSTTHSAAAATANASPCASASTSAILDWFEQANAVVHPTTGKHMQYRELLHHPDTAIQRDWQQSATNEFGRLAQGIGDIKGTDTITFIPRNEVPDGHKCTYARVVCTHRPQKTEPNRTRVTVGGNLIDYPGMVSTETADITTAKCLFNSVISTPDALFAGFDVKNFYLATPMDKPEYMRIPLALIPDAIIKQYNLRDLADANGMVYVRINKGMYGLPQAGILANQLLEKRLARHGYHKCEHTPGLWCHRWRPIQFILVVNDFGVQYVGREHALHLLHALQADYEAVSTDWAGTLYCGITLAWDYTNRTVTLSMPGYVDAALHEYQHPPPSRPEHSPFLHQRPQYGVRVQLTAHPDISAALPPDKRLLVQKICGKFLYYARCVDPTMLVALSDLASQQSAATERTAAAVTKFLNYCATHPNATLRYSASDMQLCIHTDASYLNASKGRSRIGSHHYLGHHLPAAPLRNAPILNQASILRMVVSSAAEAEVGGLFQGGKDGVLLRQTLTDMGWPQTATRLTTDNSTARGIVNDSIKQQRSRTIDMRFYWLRDRVRQGQFTVVWAPGSTNLADYFTKHHPPHHHRAMRPVYLHQASAITFSTLSATLRGCVVPPGHPDVPATWSQPSQRHGALAPSGD